MSTPKIRPTTAADAELICHFIRELARFEKLEDQMQATPELLREQLFSSNPVAHAVILEDAHGKPAGFALYFFNFSTFMGRPGLYLEDLFVLPEYRGLGFGKVLLTYLAQVALQKNCARMEWAVLDWNKRAIDLYEALGAKPQSEWMTYRLTGPALRELAAQSKQEP